MNLKFLFVLFLLLVVSGCTAETKITYDEPEAWEKMDIGLAIFYYNPTNESFRKLGLKPHILSETLINSMLGNIINNKDNINPDIILPKVKWG